MHYLHEHSETVYCNGEMSNIKTERTRYLNMYVMQGLVVHKHAMDADLETQLD